MLFVPDDKYAHDSLGCAPPATAPVRARGGAGRPPNRLF